MEAKRNKVKELYPYQKKAVEDIFVELESADNGKNILYQLPTGGGKTVIFSEVTSQYARKIKRKILILTHRIELSVQTANILNEMGVKTKVINSKIKDLDDQEDYTCFVAMVETLNNRLTEGDFYVDGIGLVIVDEAHYNSFRKIFHHFENTNILGVTATPLSSNINLPLNENYAKLIVGESIPKLIEDGYLSKATTYSFDVDLKSLKVGINGDFTVSSSEALYSSSFMLEKLINAYEQKANGRKTLIFNAGIITSVNVFNAFKEKGHPIKHLDSTYSDQERRDTLDWFKSTDNAILTSVGILTTGFDEPSVEVILLNRATRSLTLYHQMVGRGSRTTPTKKNFTIIDLGNNAKRFGLWEEEIEWQKVFANPDLYLEEKYQEIQQNQVEADYQRSESLAELLKVKPDNHEFKIMDLYREYVAQGVKPNEIMDDSIENHFQWIKVNSEDVWDGLMILKELEPEIDYRIKQYARCINATQNYIKWMSDNYHRKLSALVRANLPDE